VFIAITIENERDEDLGDGILPQFPAGFLVVISSKEENPTSWSMDKVELVGLPGVAFPEDPEPEYVAINELNHAVVTLQENNANVIVDLPTLTVTNSFTAGKVDLEYIDTEEENIINMTSSLEGIPREPDGVTWIGNEYFATADEGDMFGGSRGFTIFNTDGDVVFSSGNEMEHITAAYGHYPEGRSENKGNEPENVAYAVFDDKPFLFVNSERSSLVFVYDLSDVTKPVFLQALPSAVGPEGVVAIPERNLLVVASEKDDRGDKMRSAINIYEYQNQPPQYPSLMSAPTTNGVPVPWSAISGMISAGPDCLYAVEDSAYAKSRFFKIDTSSYPAIITKATRIKDTNGLLYDLPYGDTLVNDDLTVNIDPEGITVDGEGFLWIASEGRGTVGDSSRPVESLNMIFKVDLEGNILDIVCLPEEFNNIQVRYGIEGVTYVANEDRDYLVIALQRAWADDDHPMILAYNLQDKEFFRFFYPLDEVESQNGGWVGLSDITYLGDGKFLVLERDNQYGPDAAIKRVYCINLLESDVDDVVEKVLVADLMPLLQTTGGMMYEKIEGMAVSTDGLVWISNDNDGVDDNSGETQLLSFDIL